MHYFMSLNRINSTRIIKQIINDHVHDIQTQIVLIIRKPEINHFVHYKPIEFIVRHHHTMTLEALCALLL